MPIHTENGRAYRQFPSAKKDCMARLSTYSPSVNIEDGRLARPSLPALPWTGGPIGRQGPAVRPGRLGTLIRTTSPNSHTSRPSSFLQLAFSIALPLPRGDP